MLPVYLAASGWTQKKNNIFSHILIEEGVLFFCFLPPAHLSVYLSVCRYFYSEKVAVQSLPPVSISQQSSSACDTVMWKLRVCHSSVWSRHCRCDQQRKLQDLQDADARQWRQWSHLCHVASGRFFFSGLRHCSQSPLCCTSPHCLHIVVVSCTSFTVKETLEMIILQSADGSSVVWLNQPSDLLVKRLSDTWHLAKTEIETELLNDLLITLICWPFPSDIIT